MRFAFYGEAWKTGPTIEELLAIAKDGALFARAEESGCEGCHVEVARWRQGDDCHTGQWMRFAFNKVFGGEDVYDPKNPDAMPFGAATNSARATAERIAERINQASGNRFVSLIHRFPDYTLTKGNASC